MYRLITVAIFTIFKFSLHGQPNDIKNLYLATNHGIKFINKDSFVIDTTYNLQVTESVATLNDKNGNLVLYSNGEFISTKFHNIINSNDKLTSNNSASQGLYFYQHPKNDSIIFLLNNVSCNTIKECGLQLNEIKKVNDSFILLPRDYSKPIHPKTTEAMGIMKHSNGRDLWVINHSYIGDTFYINLLKEEGFCACSKKLPSGNYNKDFSTDVAEINFKPNGEYFSYVSYNGSTLGHQPKLYTFNAQTGRIEYKFKLENYYIGGISNITQDNKYFGVLIDFFNNEYIYEKNINIDDSVATLNNTKIHYNKIFDGNNRIADIQKVSNNKILIYRSANKTFYASLTRTDTGFVFTDSIPWNTAKRSNYRFPVFDESIFYTPAIDYTYDLDCRTNSIAFGGKDTFGATGFTYKINKNNSNIATLTGAKSQSYTFAATGVYEVLYIASNSSRTDTVIKTIEVLPKVPQDFLGADRAICAPDTSLLLQAPAGLHCYRWYNNQEQELGSSNQYLVDTIGTYICKATDNNFCTVVDTVFIGKDTLKYGLHLSRNKDTLFCSNTPTKNNPQFHWYKNESGLISLLVPKLTIKDTGIYYLIITQDSLCPSYSDTLHIDTIYGPTNINLAPIVETNLSIYPNPANTYIMVDWQGTNPITLQWIDAVGKTVLKQTFAAKSQNPIAIKTWAKGIYLVQSEGKSIGKVLVE